MLDVKQLRVGTPDEAAEGGVEGVANLLIGHRDVTASDPEPGDGGLHRGGDTVGNLGRASVRGTEAGERRPHHGALDRVHIGHPLGHLGVVRGVDTAREPDPNPIGDLLGVRQQPGDPVQVCPDVHPTTPSGQETRGHRPTHGLGRAELLMDRLPTAACGLGDGCRGESAEPPFRDEWDPEIGGDVDPGNLGGCKHQMSARVHGGSTAQPVP